MESCRRVGGNLKVVLRRWGGFTGPAGAEEYSVNVDSLPPEEGQKLRELVDAAGFFTLPPKLMKPAPQSWDFQHAMQVEDEGRKHSVQFHSDAAPEALRRLAEEVEARSSRR